MAITSQSGTPKNIVWDLRQSRTEQVLVGQTKFFASYRWLVKHRYIQSYDHGGNM